MNKRVAGPGCDPGQKLRDSGAGGHKSQVAALRFFLLLFLVPGAEELVGKPVSMQIPAVLGNAPGELTEGGPLPALP